MMNGTSHRILIQNVDMKMPEREISAITADAHLRTSP